MSYQIIDKANAIKNKIIEIIALANLTNLNGKKLTVVPNGVGEIVGSTTCPICAVYKESISGNTIPTDQPNVLEPRGLSLTIQIIDYSSTDMTKAEQLTDDLAKKIINLLEADQGLLNLILSLELSVKFDEARIEGVFYSISTITCNILMN